MCKVHSSLSPAYRREATATTLGVRGNAAFAGTGDGGGGYGLSPLSFSDGGGGCKNRAQSEGSFLRRAKAPAGEGNQGQTKGATEWYASKKGVF